MQCIEYAYLVLEQFQFHQQLQTSMSLDSFYISVSAHYKRMQQY